MTSWRFSPWRCPHSPEPRPFAEPYRADKRVCKRRQCRNYALLVMQIADAEVAWPADASVALRRNAVVLDVIAGLP